MRATFRPSEVNSKMHTPATALPRLDLRTLAAFNDLKPLSRTNCGHRNWREQLADLLDVIAIPTLLHIVGRQADSGSIFEFGEHGPQEQIDARDEGAAPRHAQPTGTARARLPM